MKTLSLILLVLSVAIVKASNLTDYQLKQAAIYNERCLKESHVDSKILEEARKGNYINDENLKRHLLCFSKMTHFQNEAGEVLLDVVKVKFFNTVKSDARTNELVQLCVSREGSPQEIAFELFKCLYKNENIKVLGI